ncbi:MAG: FAD-dependent oxidoreductase, partial [Fibrobacterota bacterium]
MLKVTDNLWWVGAQHPELRVFDVIMKTKYGTSYNSYILKTDEGNVLFETVKIKFFDQFLKNISEVCPPESIKYIVVDHTEPDHAGSLERLLEYAPQARVVGSAVAINFLKDICNRDIPALTVDHGDSLTIGDEELHFLSVPFLHWPDSIYTWIPSIKTLVTCDSFGCHYSDDRVFNDQIEGDFYPAYKYYFNMIMGPFKKHVRFALDQISKLDIDIICPGHGPVLRQNLDYYLDLYDEWSREEAPQKHSKPQIVNAFVSAYGYTEELAREINHGIRSEIDADIHLYDMVNSDHAEVLEHIIESDAFLLGTPTINGDSLPPVTNLAMDLNGVEHGGKVAAAYGSYGWSGEGPDMLNNRLNTCRMNTLEPPFKVAFKPSETDISAARDFGARFARKVIGEWEQIGSDAGDGRTFWKCTVCGEVFEGALPPMTCPVCGVGAEAFIEAEPDIVKYSHNSDMRAVIIGSGAAAVAAAEAIRKRNSTAQIDIFTDENTLPYYRPVLTEMISDASVTDEEFFVKNDNFYRENRINVHLNTRIEDIKADSKEIICADGQRESYDSLLLATGASPFVPPIQGKDLTGVFSLRSNGDVNRLKETLHRVETKEVTVIGGGLLGLETACAVAKMNKNVTVIDTAPTILPRQTDRAGSAFLSRIIEDSRIKIITDTVVQEIVGTDGTVSSVICANGDTHSAQAVVVSAGLSPNTELAQKAGISVNRAIPVNSQMETEKEGIYAAGDCAICNDTYYGIWEPALQQGTAAGANMAGERAEFTAKMYPATLNAFGTSLFCIGNIHVDENDPAVQIIRRRNDIDRTFVSYYFDKGILVGALFIGDLSKSAMVISGVNTGVSYQEALD